MNELRARDPTACPLVWSAQVEAEEKAVRTSRKAKINLTSHLKPPNLLKIGNIVKSAMKTIATESSILPP
jgi:hypothetical protein